MKSKVIYGLIYFLIIASPSFGQLRFKNDPKFNYYFDSLLVNVGIVHPQFNEIAFEFRYWIRDLSRVNAHQLIIIQQTHKGDRKFKHYQLCLEKSNYKIVDLESGDLPEWNTIWKKLIKLNMLHLESESMARSRWKSSNKDYYLIDDGEFYAFELITQKYKRQYSYTNPRQKLQTFDLNNIELVRVNEMITLLDKQLNLSKNIKKNCSTSSTID